MKKYQDAAWLQEKNDQGMTQMEIAKLCNVTNSIISHWMRKYGIEAKHKSTLKTQHQAEQESLSFGVKMVGQYIDANTKVKFECPFCSNTFEALLTSITSKRRKRTLVSCGCKQYTSGSENPKFTGCGEFSGQRFASIRYYALKRGHRFEVTVEQIWDLFLSQKRKCALTNLSLSVEDMSLDQIIAGDGYIDGNIQWVHKDVNKMKFDLAQNRVIELAKLITANQRRKARA